MGSDPLIAHLFWSFGATMVLGGSMTILFSMPARELLNDVFGVPCPSEAMRAIERMVAQTAIRPQASGNR